LADNPHFLSVQLTKDQDRLYKESKKNRILTGRVKRRKKERKVTLSRLYERKRQTINLTAAYVVCCFERKENINIKGIWVGKGGRPGGLTRVFGNPTECNAIQGKRLRRTFAILCVDDKLERNTRLHSFYEK
jgi:hypothetical protein